MKFTIVIVRPTGYRYSDCFYLLAETVMYGLRALGHEAEIIENSFKRDTKHIIFGSHLLSADSNLPPESILYNLEQVGVGNTGHLDVLGKRYSIWDYAKPNITRWKDLGIEALHVPFGYSPEMTRIGPLQPDHEDIDVLFYGSLSSRRTDILSQLANRGLKVVARANNAYGSELDAVIARAKVVLAMHYIDTANIFAISRVGYLLANKKAVVSEESVDDYPELTGGLCTVSYERLADTCQKLACDQGKRSALAAAGFDKFRTLTEVGILYQAILEPIPA